MPVDRITRYADEAHLSTMTGADGVTPCWTLSDEYRRDRPGVTLVQDGWTDEGAGLWSEIGENPEARVFCGHTPPGRWSVQRLCAVTVMHRPFLTINKLNLHANMRSDELKNQKGSCQNKFRNPRITQRTQTNDRDADKARTPSDCGRFPMTRKTSRRHDC